MVHNKLETLFSASIKANPAMWGMKLHNNPLAHQTTPADFILSYTGINSLNLDLYLVECKQVTCENGKGRLAFKRLKQMHDLQTFSNQNKNHWAYFCIAFYDGRWDNSEVYLIPVNNVYQKIISINKESFNREDMKRLFPDHKVALQKGVINLIQEFYK